MYLTSNLEQQVKIGEWDGTEEREEEDKRLMSPGRPLTVRNVNRKSPEVGILDLINGRLTFTWVTLTRFLSQLGLFTYKTEITGVVK